MKQIKNIYCVGRNYVAHVHELGNIVPTEPVIFSKPTHALSRADGSTIQLPENRDDIHDETELVVKIGRDYKELCTPDEIISEMTIGLDLSLRHVQESLKSKG